MSKLKDDLVAELVPAPKNALARRNIKVAPDPEEEVESFSKSILNEINSGSTSSIHRLSFETDPNQNNSYAGVYKQRTKLLPPSIIKRIAVQDDLVASIVLVRQNQMSAFGWPRQDRFSNGFVIEPKQTALEAIENEKDEELKVQKKEELRRRVAAANKVILNCGYTDGVPLDERLTFPQYLSQSARNAVLMGMIATEIIWRDLPNGNKKFHSFRVIDAGTIFKASTRSDNLASVRRSALHALQKIKNENLKPERFKNDEYSWVQVIEGQPRQAFTDQECLVRNFYPVPDIEMDGYPVTPLDTAISAVTTHMNITTHNKLYFQYGRASHGMLVLQSEDADERVLSTIKQQFNASINQVKNSYRMPVFAIGPEDKLSWQAIDTQGKDAEFQYLMDQNARIIMAAFMISPEEIPGWGYLSRGTNSQALSDSSNEYKLEAGRDVGIRPLVHGFEDFINTSIMPLIDPVLAEMSTFRLMGLDAETAEKEVVRMQQDMQVHLTMDQILEKVEKRPMGKEWGGELVFNEGYRAILDQYFSVGEIKEYFFGHVGAAKDPRYDYFRDAFYFQQVQTMQADAQMKLAAQQQPPDGGGDPGAEGGPPQEAPEAAPPDGSQPQDAPPEKPAPDPALRKKVAEALASLQKSSELIKRNELSLQNLIKNTKKVK